MIALNPRRDLEAMKAAVTKPAAFVADDGTQSVWWFAAGVGVGFREGEDEAAIVLKMDRLRLVGQGREHRFAGRAFVGKNANLDEPVGVQGSLNATSSPG